VRRVHIEGGHLIDPANGIDAVQNLYIAEGRVLAIGEAPAGFTADTTIDASGLTVIPGLVDLQARLREPGQEHKATIASECAAAAASGVTTLCVPPDTEPVIDTPAVVELIHQRTEAAGHARIVPLGALTHGLDGQQLSEMAELKRVGCVGVSNARRPVSNTLVLRRALEYAASHDITVFIQPRDPHLSSEGCVHEGGVSTRLGLPGIPASAETVAVAQILMLIEQTGTRVHFGQISTARAAKMIARAQHDGLPITADVACHHLHLTEMDIGYFNSNCHVQPPLRSERDRDGLRAALARGTLGAICSDHQPHDADAKLAPFCDTEPGISALETFLPLTLRLADDGILPLPDLVARLTCQPADILGIDAGRLGVGDRADVCIFDAGQHWSVDSTQLLSRGRNTPFDGWELQGKVTHTLLDGRLVYGA